MFCSRGADVTDIDLIWRAKPILSRGVRGHADWQHLEMLTRKIKRDIGEFMHDTVEPNSPYKALDGQLAKSQSAIL